ncbi:hypothetical protein D5086_025734 [Populus alba]|uniref:Uncharacterized protein n=2 Tax=Populus TaxID=3689 RepID=A0ACC4B082_POPAL|nr:uncharacterized protein LOC118041365 [Populus alba]KAJ6972034.1 hypothetical protein NC653_032565 [Populus alba x Populus x berolinensis]
MAIDVESPSPQEKPSTQRPPPPPLPAETYLTSIIKSKPAEETAPWIDNAMQQALIYQKNIQASLDTSIEASKSRFSEITSTSQAHFSQTISEIGVYEGKLFGKVKEGINVAASHPLITSAVAVGLGLVALKRPRQILYYKTLRLFTSEEALLSQADAKVKELQQSISLLKAESENLKRRASLAEEELIRGRTKLRQAGKQIQGVICSAYKIERQATGLRDILGELPRADASRFQSQVSSLASETKQERNALSKMITKISNYRISV